MTATPQGRRVNAHAIKSPDIEIPTIIEFILDETGSMGVCKDAVVAGFNDYIEEQRSVPGLCQITLTKFEGGKLVTPYQDLDIGLVPLMTDRMFNPGGMTNLYDAIGERIASVQERTRDWSVTPNVLIVVMTDGADNQSRDYSHKAIKSVLWSHQRLGWTCVYLGAQEGAMKIASGLGFKEGNIKCFKQAQMKETMRDLSAATTVYRTQPATAAAFF
jgi:hypothetical protein